MLVTHLPWEPEQIADEVEARLRSRAGSWSTGVHGAVAEYWIGADEPVETVRDGLHLRSWTDQGAFSLDLTGAAAFAITLRTRPEEVRSVVFGASRPERSDANHQVTPLGADADALRPEHRSDALFDMGVGHVAARFQIRTADPELTEVLDRARGTAWPDLMAASGPRILATAPHRVVSTALGRVEVYAPIPPPDGESPVGPHTHLLAPELAKRSELSPGTEMPSGWMPAAAFHPPRDTPGDH